MGYSYEELEAIYDSNNGYCYHCGQWLSFNDYGNPRSPWGWCVDHGNPLSHGGVHDLRNWRPSCYPCNEEKHANSTSEYGRRSERPHYFD
jgi:5-methylcytosine-specific restriction endonuclease McrA